jgi:microcin C transport system substrate-binding protein
MIRLLSVVLGALALGSSGCNRTEREVTRNFDFDAFVPSYNKYITGWLKEQQAATDKEITRVETELPTLEGEAKTRMESHLATLRLEREKWVFRLSLGDYLKTGTAADVPAGLDWKDGMEQPEIGDPAAKKGGVFRRFIETFPPTIRPFGDNSNNSFRGDLYDYIDLPLVGLHPETMQMIPGLAKEWASSPDGRTVYFRIHPEARYSDGEPLRARDFQIGAYVRVSDNIVNPYQKQYYRENIAQIAVYDDRTLSISLPEANLFAVMNAGSALPASPKFYAEYGPDYSERYQWRFPPTTGAYEVLPDGIVKGASVTQTRVKDWWARDLKFYRYRFNPDKIVSTVVRDESKAFELFRAGELDTYLLTRPELWYEKSEMEPVYNGYIDRVTFYNRYPKVPRGIYINVSKPPLDNRDVRIGIHHAMNWQKVIDVMFRGDYQRLNAFQEGFGPFSDPSIKARPYSIDLARKAFRDAGYTGEDRDGYLSKPDGTRLTVSVTYPAMPLLDRMLAILREDAKACGMELRLDGLEFTVAYKKEMQKQHEMAFSSWLVTPPLPDYYQYLHSTTARDEKGNLKPQTNNLFVWSRPDTDVLSEKVRTGATVEEVKEAAWKLQNIMHDEAIFVPGYSVDFVRVGSWRWVKWPDSENTRFCPPVVFDPHEVFVFWVDEDIKAETQAARRAGKAFPESTKIADAYRTPAETTPPVEVPATPDAPESP